MMNKTLQDHATRILSDKKSAKGTTSITAAHIKADLFRHLVDQETIDSLLEMAQDKKVSEKIARMFAGEKINFTENRPVLHIAMRANDQDQYMVDGHDVMPDVLKERTHFYDFARRVRSGQWVGKTGKAIQSFVHIGIGGSVLGTHMTVRALKHCHDTNIKIHFVSNVDGTDLHETLQQCDPETTLFYIASKSFTTTETMTNADSARQWLVKALGEEAVAYHFAAASTAVEKVTEFGINADNMFPFWNWVGGRFSSWSSIGMALAIAIGPDQHQEWLDGARAMDQHFKTTELTKNLPAILGLLGIWYRNFLECPLYTIAPYAQALEFFGRYVQQVDMESNGKQIDSQNNHVSYETGALVFGEAGTNAQHSYFQLLHQGTTVVPVDFIVVEKSQYDGYAEHHKQLLANAKAQPDALWLGRSVTESDNNPHKAFPGKRPSTILSIPELTPYNLGSLMALYEHKIFIQGIIWDINSFDQFGVELGKEMALKNLKAYQG